ncbi:MAG: hypothetical protein WCJ68_04515 [Chitinophagia bacterium]|jgi:hypothetical protein
MLFASYSYAQTISMDQPPMEDALRRLQLMGKIEGDISFMLRPIQSTRLHSWDSVLQSIDPSVKAMGNQKIDKHFLGKWGYASILPVQLTQQYVTAQPYQELDGAMIASSGYQLMATAGVYAKIGPLTIQLQPQFVSASNSDFRGTTQTPNYNKTFWGNSSIRLNAGPVSIGISSENITWGPSLMNPLIMSAHAPGFMHLTFNSRKPWRTPIGSFEWQWFATYLDAIEPKYNGIADYANGDPTKRRYFNGAMFSYQPKWIKGLSVGVTRVVQEPESLYTLDKQWNLLFNNVARINDASFLVEIQRDQYAAAFLRWVWEPAHAEFYTEWGRNDTYYTMRDFIQQPEHSRAYTYGFRKLFGTELESNQNNSVLKTPKKYWQFISEYTRTQQPSTWPVRSAGSWYVRGDMPGYTQMGQIMGAPIGSGGNYQMMRISKFNGWKQIGLQLESTTHNAENFEDTGLAFTNPSLTKWVDYGCRILFDYPYKKYLFSTTLAATRSFNYHWSQPANASGLGLGNPNDLDSYLLKFTIRYL